MSEPSVPRPRRLAGGTAAAEAWCGPWRRNWADCQVLALLAATDTAAVEGISAAGATASSRRQTAAADAELLLLGPCRSRPHALPPLPAGVSPALIGHVVLDALALVPLVVDLGCAVAPAVPHLRPAGIAAAGPARCLSGGEAMEPARVAALLSLGRRWGERFGRRFPGRPLLIAECVPGGTTTALGLLRGLGVKACGLVSGSLLRPAHELKADLVNRGLRAAGLTGAAAFAEATAPDRVVASLGDPMQPLAAALALAAALTGSSVLLAGGSQMAAVLALALALAPPAQRARVAARVAIGTTAWVAEEPHSDLAALLRRIGSRWQVDPLAFSADLRFGPDGHPALAAYGQGYVKEGVGAGGLALLWQLSGRDPAALARSCERACRLLLPHPAQVVLEPSVHG